MLFYIILGVAALLVILITTLRVRSQAQKKADEAYRQERVATHRRKMEEVAQKILAARTPQQLWAVIYELERTTGRGLRNELSRLGSRRNTIWLASIKWRTYEERRDERKAKIQREHTLDGLIESLVAAKSIEDKLLALMGLLRSKISANSQAIDELVKDYLEEDSLLGEIEQTAGRDLEGFLEVREYFRLMWDGDTSYLKRLDRLKDLVPYPKGWYKLVVKFLQDPSINEFPGIHKLGTTPMLVAENAAKAISERDLVGVQIARAHAANKKAHREMMGDVMLEQLNRLVAELHKEQGLFQTEAGSVKA